MGKEKVKAIDAKRKEELRILAALYRHVFDRDDAGRKVFRDLMEHCMVFKQTMAGNAWTSFNEGKRSVGLHIFNMRELDIEEELTMMRNETYNKTNKEGE